MVELETHAVNALVGNMQDSDSAVRIEAFRSITDIARALGAERTREEFIPYLRFVTTPAQSLHPRSEPQSKAPHLPCSPAAN
jgi:hypothetical protein